MSHTHAMLDTFPGGFGLDRDRLAEAIDVLVDCAATCTQCGDACLSESDAGEMARCIRRNLDCADVCTATSRVLARQTEYDAAVTAALVEACRTACRSCAEECEQHAGAMEHCRICAEVCRTCAEACEQLLQAMR